MYTKPFSKILKTDVTEAGGKGASLGEMFRLRLGYAGQVDYVNPVPSGFVVLASAFDRFLKETSLDIEITARLKEVNINDVNSLEKASVIIRDAIHDREMPEDLGEEILQGFDELTHKNTENTKTQKTSNENNLFVAVRSSATAEDSSVASWAGELETYLNITRENVCEKVKQCWSSLFTPRAIFYRHEKKLIDHYVSVAVVVQKMVQSEISGIAFTVHPVTEDFDQMIIEAGYGLGEAIVSCLITPDSYVVSKSEMKIIDVNVGEQSRKLTLSPDHFTTLPLSNQTNVWVELGEEGEKQKLSKKQIIELAEICKNIEKHYGFPCDIEWAFEHGVFYITQSRPITTLKNNK